MLKGQWTLFIDQHGQIFNGRTLADLKDQIAGRVSKMYRDKADGSIVHCGYVIGQHWLTAYAPIEVKV